MFPHFSQIVWAGDPEPQLGGTHDALSHTDAVTTEHNLSQIIYTGESLPEATIAAESATYCWFLSQIYVSINN